MKIVSLNVHFWSDESSNFIAQELISQIKATHPDIICLQEVLFSCPILEKGTPTWNYRSSMPTIAVHDPAIPRTYTSIPVDLSSSPNFWRTLRLSMGLPRTERPRLLAENGLPVSFSQVRPDGRYILERAGVPWGKESLTPGTILHKVASELGLEHSAFAGTVNPDFGNAILSRFPLSSISRYELPHPPNMPRQQWSLRVAVSAAVASPEPIGVICTHLDHVSEQIRHSQCQGLMQHAMGLMARYPVVLAGDFNALTRRDYSDEQWEDITATRSEAKWEAPHDDVTRFIQSLGYADAAWQAPKGAATSLVAPTCAYGTRIDYIYLCERLHGAVTDYTVKSCPATDHDAVVMDMDAGLMLY
eukprot:gnl/Dysnectes_brevis/1360_a1529_3600.p1 GENE.gnl/Dysnectes_brevis/1360_a1529_3600~~gnl/Dysnectes_brevis/1360_a1529_3600.p1  ORF type:complete len:377 (+),score=106.68 gnl/Dysnectes_brevis/1360_a1529_3600:52-1131(+)